MLCMLQPFLMEHQIKIGRDALFNLLAAHQLLVRRRRRKIATTQSRHWFKRYPNLIKDWSPSLPQQLWVSDITYVAAATGFLYLSLVTDAYSHKIMGYCIADNLAAVHTAKALTMAIGQLKKPYNLIHHSDRGIQYCCSEYVNLLKQTDIKISMTETGDPLENPVAERINGIIKNEYLNHYSITDQHSAMQLLEDIVFKYNEQRPHQSINMLTPQIAHQLKLSINKKWGKSRSLPNIVNS